MDSYDVVRKLGQGAFGEVTECRDKKTGQRFAVKVISNKKYETWEECLKLREVRALRQLGSQHENIVVLRQVIRENKKLFLVFDYHPTTLHRRLHKLKRQNEKELGPQKRFPLPLVAKWSFQLLSAVAFMHRYGFFHRDIKPENLLLDADDNIKVCDFGLARDVRSRPPYTNYVSTRWYRAPELVLRSDVYNSPVDIWACACVIAELLTLKPLFPAKDKLEHLLYISSLVGPITSKTWSAGYALVIKQTLHLPSKKSAGQTLNNLLLERFYDSTFIDPSDESYSIAVQECVDLQCEMLQLDPHTRPSAVECLQHAFLRSYTKALSSGLTSTTEPPIPPHTSSESDSATLSLTNETDALTNKSNKKSRRPQVIRRDSQLRILTQEIDELTKEIEDISTISPQKQHSVLPPPVTTQEEQKPDETIESSQKPKIERSNSMERRKVISQYLNDLEDDEDDEEDEEAMLQAWKATSGSTTVESLSKESKQERSWASCNEGKQVQQEQADTKDERWLQDSAHVSKPLQQEEEKRSRHSLERKIICMEQLDTDVCSVGTLEVHSLTSPELNAWDAQGALGSLQKNHQEEIEISSVGSSGEQGQHEQQQYQMGVPETPVSSEETKEDSFPSPPPLKKGQETWTARKQIVCDVCENDRSNSLVDTLRKKVSAQQELITQLQTEVETLRAQLAAQRTRQ